MKFSFYRYLCFAIASALMLSCSSEEPEKKPVSETGKVFLTGEVAPFKRLATRSQIVSNADGWTTTWFAIGEKLGLYSYGGNLGYSEEQAYGPFYNAYLEYNGDSFDANDFNMDATSMTNTGTKIYFPYYEEMGDEFNIINSKGMPLRILDTDGIYKCVDFMYMPSITVNGQINGRFEHMFSELVIVRGDGFDNPVRYENGVPVKDESVWVVLDKGYTNIKIMPTTNSWTFRLENYPEYLGDPDDEEPTPDGDQSGGFLKSERWEAWKRTQTVTNNGEEKEVSAWYVVLPTYSTGSYQTTVEYIELYDNNGTLQRVSNFILYDGLEKNDKKVGQGWQYAVTIYLDELEAVVQPTLILPWEKDTEITEERTRGINDITEYNTFVETYNSNSGKGYSANSPLLAYGDWNQPVEGSGEEGYWTFYILSDLNFTASQQPAPILNLQDEINGTNGFYNYTISGINNTEPFIYGISGKGALNNLDFENLFIEGNDRSVVPLGGLFSTMSGGSLTNVNVIAGTIFFSGSVGMLAGSVVSADNSNVNVNINITNCRFSGLIVGSGSINRDPYKYLFGEVPEDQNVTITVNNTDVSGIVFTSSN